MNSWEYTWTPRTPSGGKLVHFSSHSDKFSFLTSLCLWVFWSHPKRALKSTTLAAAAQTRLNNNENWVFWVCLSA